jgi:hypothetical protein
MYQTKVEENNTVLVKVINYTIEHEKFKEYKLYTGDVNRPKTINKITSIGRRNKFIINLLEEVFEGKTVRQRIGAENLTDDLKSEMNIFYHFALEFLRPNIMPSRKRDIKELIIEHLKPHSEFTAFKVWVIKRNRKLFQEFSQYLPS